jgi:hypothetical protein
MQGSVAVSGSKVLTMNASRGLWATFGNHDLNQSQLSDNRDTVAGRPNFPDPESIDRTPPKTLTPRPSLQPEPKILLKLASRLLVFADSDIPDPPNMPFAGSMSFMHLMWDDALPGWNNTSPLFICGISVAIKYWLYVYSYRRPLQWSGIKQRWHGLRVSPLNIRMFFH